MMIKEEWLDNILTHCKISRDFVRNGKNIDAYAEINTVITMLEERMKVKSQTTSGKEKQDEY